MMDKSRYSHIFSPLKVGNITLKNRLAFSPMVCNKCTWHGEVTQGMVNFIHAQAATGVAYVTIGDSQVDQERGANYPCELNTTDEDKLPGLCQLAEAARLGGAYLSVELSFCGAGARDALLKGKEALAPSAVPIPSFTKNIKVMDRQDMDDLREKFCDCADRCRRAGFGLVMIHCAHNNFLGQWLSPMSNHRNDEYGGSPENRMRYPLEVLRAVRERVGNKLAIEIRVSASEEMEGGLEFEESLAFMKKAQEYVDIIHVSRGDIYTRAAAYTLPTYLKPHMLNVEYAARAKKELHVPVATVGNITSLEEAEEIIASGKADIIAMARAYLADFDLIKKSLDGRPEDVRPCLKCHHGCIDSAGVGQVIRCSVNPSLGFEELISSISPSSGKRKKVLVIGGGPAGMTAAQFLTKLGHSVVLCEKSDSLGGLLKDAAAANFKIYMKDYLSWMVRTTMKCGAEIRLGTEVTPKLVEELNPEKIFVATGSEYKLPELEGIDGADVVMLSDAEHHQVPIGENVVVCGGGTSALECAYALALEGHKVTVVGRPDKKRMCRDMPFLLRHDLFMQTEKLGVKMLTGQTILCFGEHMLKSRTEDGQEECIPFDTAILAFGTKVNRALYDSLYERYGPKVVAIGDLDGGKNIYDATHSAFFAALHV